MSFFITGHPAQVEAYLNSPAGRSAAYEMALAIFDDSERRWGYERGGDTYPEAVERHLDRLLADDARRADREVA